MSDTPFRHAALRRPGRLVVTLTSDVFSLAWLYVPGPYRHAAENHGRLNGCTHTSLHGGWPEGAVNGIH
jgi:hypothetical protein